MIIGEIFDQNAGYEENYDYLFKRKGGAPAPRQQKKAEKKAGKPNKPGGRLMQKRQDRKPGIAPKKRLIMGNFGLFNKNKKKEEAAQAAAAATPDVATQTDTDNSQDAGSVENTAQNTQSPEMNAGTESNADNQAASAQEEPAAETPSENTETEEPSESSYDEPAAKTETKADKSNDKTSGVGKWIGWGFLGLTVVVIGYTMYRLDKMEASLPHNSNLHPNA